MRHLRQLATVLGLAALLAALAVGPVSGSYPGRHNGRIAVGVRANGAANIVTFNPDGSGMRQLTSGPGFKLCPTYSPDGRTIAYCGTAGDAFEIWTMKQTGTEQRQLTHLGGFATFPDFSPRTCTAAACFPSTKARTASTRRSRWGPAGASGPNWLGSGLGSLWVGIPNTGSVVRFAPGTGTVEADIPAPAGTVPCGGFAVGLGALVRGDLGSRRDRRGSPGAGTASAIRLRPGRPRSTRARAPTP